MARRRRPRNLLLEIGTRLADARDRMHMSQFALASYLGRSPSLIRRWEWGEIGPKVEDLLYACAVLHVAPVEILFGNDRYSLAGILTEMEAVTPEALRKAQMTQLERWLEDLRNGSE